MQPISMKRLGNVRHYKYKVIEIVHMLHPNALCLASLEVPYIFAKQI